MVPARLILFAILFAGSSAFAQSVSPVPDMGTSSSKMQFAFRMNEGANVGAPSAAPSDAAPPVMLEPVRPVRFASCDESVEKDACRLHWRPALTQAAQFLFIQHMMNMPTYNGTLKGPFFHDWFHSVKQYRFSRFQDDDPYIVNYVGHPMMGSIVSWIEIQNDPRGQRQVIGWKKAYFKSRAKALAFASVYAVQWEIGPFSETSIGNLGSFKYYSASSHHLTNGTGFTDMLVTPTAGVAWSMGEDLIDHFVIRKIENHSRNPLYLMGISMLNPTRGAANLLRLKTPWYRDTRSPGETR